MKRLIRSLIPKSLFQGMLGARDRILLARCPARSFDCANLCREDALRAGNVLFSNPAAEQQWNEDHEAINSAFGDDNVLGGVNPGDRRALYYLIRSANPTSVLEIGTHIGASTLYIARALRANRNGGTVTTVDVMDVNDPRGGPWREAGRQRTPAGFAELLDCTNIDFVVGDSIGYMSQKHRTFGFIFLDGDHSSRAVYQEVALALELLEPGGIILLHDYYPDARPLFPDGFVCHGPFLALRRIRGEQPELSVRPLGSLPWPTKLGSTMTSLALVLRCANSKQK